MRLRFSICLHLLPMSSAALLRLRETRFGFVFFFCFFSAPEAIGGLWLNALVHPTDGDEGQPLGLHQPTLPLPWWRCLRAVPKSHSHGALADTPLPATHSPASKGPPRPPEPWAAALGVGDPEQPLPPGEMALAWGVLCVRDPHSTLAGQAATQRTPGADTHPEHI